ncbi:MAG TPA: 5-oxoprolinase subunit PxpA [Longimicrobiales bacterium]
MLRLDLNCDMGEGAGRDAELMPHITSANIACGGHAGDETVMRETLLLARQHDVAAGAHPGYPDREGFGRRRMDMTPRAIYESVLAQIAALLETARIAGVPVRHVKPHGALYNDAAADAHVARSVVRAVHDTDPGLLVYGLAGSTLITEAERVGLRAVGEAFADRAYQPDGTLMPRALSGALIDDPEAAAARVLRLATTGRIRSSGGSDLTVRADTVCIHGDGPNAVAIAREVHRVLIAAGIRLAAPSA